MQQIADWLESLGLGQYAELFADNGIDLSVLPEPREEEHEDEDGESHKTDADENTTDTPAVCLHAGPTEGRDGLVLSGDPAIVAARVSRWAKTGSRAWSGSVHALVTRA